MPTEPFYHGEKRLSMKTVGLDPRATPGMAGAIPGFGSEDCSGGGEDVGDIRLCVGIAEEHGLELAGGGIDALAD